MSPEILLNDGDISSKNINESSLANKFFLRNVSRLPLLFLSRRPFTKLYMIGVVILLNALLNSLNPAFFPKNLPVILNSPLTKSS